MIAKVRVLRLYLDRPYTHTGTHLRGAVLGQFPNRELLHNRRSDGRARLPDVRYVVVDHVPHIVGVGSGCKALLSLYQGISTVVAGTEVYRVTGSELIDAPHEFAITRQMVHYRTATPWLGLNQANHQLYREGASSERRALLERIVVGNLLVALRQVGIELDRTERLLSSVHAYRDRTIRVRDQRFCGFYLELAANIHWPIWLGLGKQTAKGFGLIRRQ